MSTSGRAEASETKGLSSVTLNAHFRPRNRWYYGAATFDSEAVPRGQGSDCFGDTLGGLSTMGVDDTLVWVNPTI